MIVSQDLISYYEEILNFLSTVSIKNEKFIDMQNNYLKSRNILVDDKNPASWKYYLNLRGEYHASDHVSHPVLNTQGPIHVKSLDVNNTWIPFTKASLASHPITRTGYLHDTQNYRNLKATYPDHVDLIKNILYPLADEDLNKAVNAPNLTLLRWPGMYDLDGEKIYLEKNELFKIIQDLKEFLLYIREKWYKDWLSEYEEAYEALFWGNLFQHLFARIIVSRMENIHTAFVHSFHIWEYLKSVGIGDYRDALTSRQALFLYRNMKHILKNRGRHENLILLVNELLREERLTMINMVIRQETLSWQDEYRWSPEFVPEPIDPKTQESLSDTKPKTVTTILNQLNAAGHENDNSADYALELKKILSGTVKNRSTTKILEIQSETGEGRYKNLFAGFFIDNLIYVIKNNLLTDVISFTDTESGILLSLTPKEALLLIHYISGRLLASHLTVSEIPTKHTYITGAFNHLIQTSDIPSSNTHKNIISLITEYVNFIPEETTGFPNLLSQNNLIRAKEAYMKDMLDVWRPFKGPTRSPLTRVTLGPSDNFTTITGNLFNTFLNKLFIIRSRALVGEYHLHTKLFDSLLERGTVNLNLTASPNYVHWFNTKANIKSLVNHYEGRQDRQEIYGYLMDKIISLILDYENPIIEDYVEQEEEKVRFFGRLRDLFIQLCSYNVIFLDTVRSDTSKVMYFPNIHINYGGFKYKNTVTYPLEIDIRFPTRKVSYFSKAPIAAIKSDVISSIYKDRFNADVTFYSNLEKNVYKEKTWHDIAGCHVNFIKTTHKNNLRVPVNIDIKFYETPKRPSSMNAIRMISKSYSTMTLEVSLESSERIEPEQFRWRLATLTPLKDNNPKEYVTSMNTLRLDNLSPSQIYYFDVRTERGKAHSTYSSEFHERTSVIGPGVPITPLLIFKTHDQISLYTSIYEPTDIPVGDYVWTFTPQGSSPITVKTPSPDITIRRDDYGNIFSASSVQVSVATSDNNERYIVSSPSSLILQP